MATTLEGFHLSTQQKAVWASRRHDGSKRCQCIFLLEGALDTERLGQALSRIVSRYEVFRTGFVSLPGMDVPLQTIAENARPGFEIAAADWAVGMHEEAALKSLLAEQRERPYDEELGPFARFLVAPAGPERHFLLVTVPALCADSVTLHLLTGEILRWYGTESETEDRPLQYVDFAEWQAEMLSSSEEGRDGQAFWNSRLSDCTAPPRLPGEVEADSSERDQRHTVASLEAREASVLIEAAAKQGTSLESWLAACWHTLLSRLTRAPKITICCWHDGRRMEQLNRAWGCFEQFLPISFDWRASASFGEVLEKTTEKLQLAELMQDSFTFADGAESGESGSIGFRFQSWPEPQEGSGIRCTMISRFSQNDTARLMLVATGSADGRLRLELEYNDKAWKTGAIERLGGELLSLLFSTARQPEARVSDLSILSAAERQKLLVDWVATSVPYPVEQTWADLFEAQAAASPDAEGLVVGEERLRFGELNTRANRLAHYLRQKGVTGDVPVGICLERSADLIIGILGALKAGGAYVPIEPGHPTERTAKILADCQVAVVVTHSALVSQFGNAELVCVDCEGPAIAEACGDNPKREISDRNLAYILYTSGSTGTPKGVMVEHRSLYNLTHALHEAVYRSKKKPLRVGLNATLAFDGSIKQLVQLAWGHALYLIPEATRGNPREMIGFLAENAIDAFDCTPSLLRLLLAEGLGEAGRYTPELLLIGGEALEEADWQLLAARNIGAVNLYGPTECTVDATACPIQSSQSPSLGGALPNVRLYVLDENCEPTPIGVAGELCIAGAGLARGYRNQPALTAQRFVPDPFGQMGERLYRSGDRASWGADGKLAYLGRVDGQVKVRGYRVELGEIESVLSSHPGVQQAVAVVDPQAEGGRLVAYVTSHGAFEDGSELRWYLQTRVPEYMVPSAVVVLKELPLTANGKVDRKALPAPEYRGSSREAVKPRTPVEEILAAIWSEVLKLERVSIDDNFFALGGHSLLATQVISRTRNAFGIELPLRVLFEAPTIAGVAQQVEQMLREGEGVEGPPLTRISREQALPLSFAQQRLWFLNQIDPESTAYNGASALHLRGALDVQALEGALEEIVRRHEVLRTSFRQEQGEPVQYIRAFGGLSVSYIDLSGAAEPEELARAAAREEAAQPFHLGEDMLLRAKLLRLRAEEHVLLVTLHHIVSDGWSVAVLVREFTALYEAFAQQRPSPLAELPIQYADFAHWQRRWLTGEVLERQLAYWRGQLAGVPVLESPSDAVRSGMPSGRGGQVKLRLEAELVEQLERLSRERGVTLFMTLLGSFQLLLGRYCGQQDVPVGTVIANRTRLETEGLIGFFVNTLVLRSRLEPGARFVELLGQVRRTVLGAYAHQELPFERLVEELAPERLLGQTPLFQALLVLQNTPQERLQMAGVELSGWESGHVAAKFDLMLALAPREGGALEGALEYATDLFGAARMERLAGHFTGLLKHIVERPEARLWELPLLEESERRQLLEEWNPAARPVPAECVQELFEAQVERTPQAAAVRFGEESLSYRELNERANQLAHWLRKSGVRAETRVAVCLERGLELTVSLLAILKAGGAYVPLDPSYPPQRLAFMLEDAHAHTVITQQHLLVHLPHTGARIISLDGDSAGIVAEVKDNPTGFCTPKNLAYVIYTSGSTGKPKGVMIQHESVATFLAWSREIYSPEEMAGVLASTSICFDLSAFELFGPLTCGGTVILARNALELPQLPCAEQVTLVNTVPSAMTELLNMGGVPARVKTVNLAGEALADGLVKRLYKELPIQRVFNLYGPSEDTTYSTYCLLSRESGEKVSIGKAITNSQAYVLDEWLEPLPIGTAGELYLGGAGLARGYLDRPDLTAERFIPDPFSQTSGARLYRTGDRVRHLADGRLDFLGRMDHQVKLRGFRIELGEIESVLAQCTGVTRALAIVREDTPGDKRLVAYVSATKPFPAVATLRAAVAQSLPEYMVPNAIVMLEKLPLNSNGKIDRAALPAPEYGGDGFASSLTPTEEMLAGIWSQVLKTESIGSVDNFFELGGHSLLATQVISRVRQVFQAEMPLRAIFEFPILSAFAKRVEDARQLTDKSAPPLARADRSTELPLSFAQQRMWFVDQLEPGTGAYNIPFGLRLRGEVDVEALQRSLEEIGRRHEVLRTAFPSRNGRPMQEIAEEPKLRIELLDLSRLEMEARECEARRCARALAEASFDLSSGPLVRVQLVRLAADDHLLLVTMHHIISDGWSLGIFAREFAEVYTAHREARIPVLKTLTVQFADFAAWQWQQAQRGALSRHLEYWRKQLAGLEAFELPTDRTRPAVFHSRAARQPVFLSSELTSKLKETSRREGVTLFMTLLAVFQVLMARYSGQEDIAIGTDIANRNRMESEDLIGCFVNQLVLRSRVDRGSSFSDLLKQVRETVLDAYAHQDVPFDVLVDELNPTRDLSRTPLFQVLLTLENTPRTEDCTLPGLEVMTVEGDPQWAKFDLHVSLREVEGHLEGVVEYATELFDGQTVEQLIRHWERLLDSAAQNSNEQVRSLSMLAREELDQQLVTWNNTANALPQTCAHRLFEEQAECRPNAPAVIHENTALTYGELNRDANQLARYLRKKGVGPEIRAGVCLARTPRLVTALLAVLKAGGVYVPLDPNYPPERLTYIREDSVARVLITENGAAQLLAGADPAFVLSLDTEQAEIEKEDDGNLSTNIDFRNLSYSMYTSGSTGKPKGALIEHRGMLNHLLAKVEELNLTCEDVVAETAPSSFDISVWQILAPLLAGGRVQIIDDETAHDGAALLQEAARTGVTVLETVPAMLGAMLADDERRPRALPKLRWMISNAEALPIAQCERWSEEYPDVPLLNAYGPTECSDDIAHYEVQPGGIKDSAYAPLGAPLMNTTVYVLDKAMEALPVGAVGELYIGGTGVGRGYWKRPELTAQRFVPNPFSAGAGERLYRTGDLMRWRRDGMLEFIGRVDDQIKLRGFRIELGEIESVLEEHPGTERALVMVREDEPGRKELAAYVLAVKNLTREDLVPELRELCRARLPHYMAPGAITVLDSFPLSPNGKIDRKALPRPERRSSERGLEQMPQTEVERTLAAIWGEVLKMDSIGAEENFFEIGGHSLLATQVMARLRQAFSVDLPLRTIFEWPTVRGLAEQIERQNSALNTPLPAGLQIERKLSEEELMLASLDDLSEEEISELIEQVGQTL